MQYLFNKLTIIIVTSFNFESTNFQGKHNNEVGPSIRNVDSAICGK